MIRIAHFISPSHANVDQPDNLAPALTFALGPVGPGKLLHRLLNNSGKVVITIICDITFVSNSPETVTRSISKLITLERPDTFIAGPAFNDAGYGLACGELCRWVHAELGIPVLTAMSLKNPGVLLCRDSGHVIETAEDERDLVGVLWQMANVILKCGNDGTPNSPPEETDFQPDCRKNSLSDRRASQRAIDLLLKKMKGESFETEIP